MQKIRIGGVPEHFNTPWHWARGKELFQQAGIEVIWQDYPGGTGAMNQALRQGELDIAIVLTEGIVADIANGNPSKIIRYFVASPLVWGVFVPAASSVQSVDELSESTFAISRYGSGSHLMVELLAKAKGWPQPERGYQVTQNLEGTRQAFKKDPHLGFLWEKFTTQPLVDTGEFRKVGEFPTPWNCFAMAATDSFLKDCSHVLPALFRAIAASCKELAQHPKVIKIVAEHAKLKPQEVDQWLQTVRWAESDHVPVAEIQQVADTLLDCGILPQRVEAKALLLKISYSRA